jgi:hypothetical protein
VNDGHWWHRLADHAQAWFVDHDGEPLDDEAFDAVIGAGGLPSRHEPGGEGLPDSRLLSEADWEYIREQRRAQG